MSMIGVHKKVAGTQIKGWYTKVVLKKSKSHAKTEQSNREVGLLRRTASVGKDHSNTMADDGGA